MYVRGRSGDHRDSRHLMNDGSQELHTCNGTSRGVANAPTPIRSDSVSPAATGERTYSGHSIHRVLTSTAQCCCS